MCFNLYSSLWICFNMCCAIFLLTIRVSFNISIIDFIIGLAIIIISFIQSYLFFPNENSLDKKLIVWSAPNYATQKYRLDSLYRSHTQLIHKLLFQYDIVLNSVKTRSIHEYQIFLHNRIQKKDNPFGLSLSIYSKPISLFSIRVALIWCR